ncbi:MAG TPA: 4-(cytidine 5'-diphospho)-2-C-methyl-D-erythritol kinase [Dehalococcoidia bacterium]|nr:4-(cytidine 5'-diphospho)-2-C-methyl-D-erythritol kinase [Dehalococcoidia bacterium]
MLLVTAPAKINLTLEVLGKRPDGYHQVKSLFQTIALCDTLFFEPSGELEFSCTRRDLEHPGNLVVEASRRLQEAAGREQGARIHLEKRIPVAAGLGGGSSDAAAALIGLNRLWGLGWSRDQLWPVACALGSDVPFFLYGGTALVEGRGDEVTPLPALPRQWVLLLRPPIGEIMGKTAQLYAALKETYFTEGQHTSQVVARLRAGGAFDPSTVFNVFERVAAEVFPGLDYFRQQMAKAGAQRVYLAGSGPTLFTLMSQRARAQKAYHYLRGQGVEVYLVETMEARS